MKLSTEEVKKIGLLARIGLKAAEITKFQTELSEVTSFNAEKLAQITKAPEVEFVPTESLGQADEPAPSLTQDEALAGAPSRERGYFVVPKVLDP